MDAFEQLRAGHVAEVRRPIAEPVVIESGWAELERLADTTDRVIAQITTTVRAMERRHGLRKDETE